MQAKYFLFFSLLLGPTALAMDNDMPTLDFLEYLGELETDIDGELINPTEFETVVENIKDEETDHE